MRTLVAITAVLCSAGLGLAQPAPSPAVACTGNQPEIVKCLNELVAKQQIDINNLKSAVTTIPNLNDIVIEYVTPGNCITYLGNGQLVLREVCNDPNRNKFRIRPF
jgi:hypothetical protein